MAEDEIARLEWELLPLREPEEVRRHLKARHIDFEVAAFAVVVLGRSGERGRVVKETTEVFVLDGSGRRTCVWAAERYV